MNPKDEEPSPGPDNPNGKHHPQISVRLMELDDIPLVYHLGEELFGADEFTVLHRTWDEYEVVDLFQSDGDFCFVAETDERLAGFALGTIIDKPRSSWTYGWLLWLGVDPAFQKSGVGQKLFKRYRIAALEAGARILMVDTEADNTKALRFFGKLGFNSKQEHVYLAVNIDEERRQFEKRKHKREVRQIMEEERERNGES